VKTPTDLLGIQIERFSYTSNTNLTSSIGVIASKFKRLIREEGKRTFNLINSWDFLEDERAFTVNLDPERLKLHSDKLSEQKLVLAWRKRDPLKPRDEDTAIVKSDIRPFKPNEQHVSLKASSPDFNPKSGDILDGYLFLVPMDTENDDIIACKNMEQLKDVGCLLLDRDFGKQLK